ncbi:MAG: hypothetical protein PHV34_15905 [Verrucomicrobiae bacterium]|nr:hypothetical protein [Verrucomicrobiae bacterium]
MARVFSINNHLRALLAAACLLVSVQPGRSCGLSWGVPRSFFDHVDFQGHVLHVETVGSLDLDKIQAPLYVFFNSSLNIPSPYLGGGQAGSWCVPLLEAKMYQVDDNNYKLEQPDGWFRVFQIDKKNPSILHGQGGWKAEKNGPSLFVYATCDTKMVFNQGRIAQFQTKDKKLDYLYMNNRVSEIREGGTPILRVETAPMTGEVTGFLLRNNQRIAIEKIKLPSLTPGLKEESCLARVVKADGTSSSFEYGTDDQKNPTLKLNGARLLAWDAKTRQVLKDGSWTYEVQPSKGIFENAAIGRVNDQKQREFWHYQGNLGREETLSLEGVKTVKTWFVSGKMSGLLRKIEQTTIKDGKNSKPTVTYQATYNENAQKIREVNEKGEVTTFKYDQAGNQIAAVRDGKTLWEKGYDSAGRLTYDRRESGLRIYREYTGTNSFIRTYQELNGTKVIEVVVGDKVQQKTYPNGKTCKFSYHKDTGALRERVEADGTRWVYEYDYQAGDFSKIFKNGLIFQQTVADPENPQRRIVITYKSDGTVDGAYDRVSLEALKSEEVARLVSSLKKS